MLPYEIDGTVPWLRDSEGKVVGYRDNNGVDRDLEGSLLDRETLNPIAALSARVDDVLAIRNVSDIKSRLVAASVVDSSPPTITQTTTNSTTISSGVIWPAVSGGLPTSTYECIGSAPLPWSTVPTHLIPMVGGATAISNHATYRFFTDSSEIELRLLNYNTKLNIRVDGRLVQQAAFSFSAAGSTQMLKLGFGSSAVRLIEVCGFNMPFGGVYTTPTGSIWPAPVVEPFMWVIGDSYTQGTGADSVDQTWAAVFARLMGYAYNSHGIGGSGYRTASPNDPVTRISTVIPSLRQMPDVAVVALGYNDAAASQSEISVACTSTIQALKQYLPSSKIVVVGPWTPLGDTTTLTNTRSTILACAQSAGVEFLDIQGIITAANASGYGNGDSVHPNAAGHYLLGQRAFVRHI